MLRRHLEALKPEVPEDYDGGWYLYHHLGTSSEKALKAGTAWIMSEEDEHGLGEDEERWFFETWEDLLESYETTDPMAVFIMEAWEQMQ